MPEPIDRVGHLGADRTPAGLNNFRVMKNDPVWSQLAGEIAAQQNLVLELKTQFNALLVKIDADSGDTGGDSDYEATLEVVSPDPKL